MTTEASVVVAFAPGAGSAIPAASSGCRAGRCTALPIRAVGLRATAVANNRRCTAARAWVASVSSALNAGSSKR
jgi:hypothetical protein